MSSATNAKAGPVGSSGIGSVGGGALWTLIGYGGMQVLRLLSNLVMTRLLAPEAFGLLSIALTVNVAAVMLTDIGIKSSIVRSERGGDQRFLRTAWVTAIARNAILFALVLTSAWALAFSSDRLPVDSIYAEPVLPAFVAIAGLQLLVMGFASPNLALAERQVQLGRVVVLEVGSQACAIAAMIACALAGLGAWSLLIGLLVGAVMQTVSSHVLLPGPAMAFEWNRDDFSELFAFGKWLLIASLFGFVLNRGDQLIFGYLFEARDFSLYVIASLWVTAVIGVAGTVMQRVCYPALSAAMRAGDDIDAVYHRFRLFADALAVAMFLALCVGIGPFFEVFYRNAYEDAVSMVRLLSVSVLLLPYRLINTVILSGGDSRRFSLIVAVPALAMLVALPLADATGGQAAAVLTFGLIQLVTVPMCWWLGRQHLTLTVATEGRMLLATALAVAALTTGWGIA